MLSLSLSLSKLVNHICAHNGNNKKKNIIHISLTI